MTLKISGILFLPAAVLSLAIFTFFSANMSCYDVHTNMQRKRNALIEESQELMSLSVRMGALAIKYLPNGKEMVKKMEAETKKLRDNSSTSEMAISCNMLYTTMKRINFLLKDNIKSKNNYRFLDASQSFTEASRRLAAAGKEYNKLAIIYNETLQKPLPRFWRYIIDYQPAELFTIQKRNKKS